MVAVPVGLDQPSFLVFRQQGSFALPLGVVREIIHPGQVWITPVPNTFGCVQGLMNVRGESVLVLDLGYWFSQTRNPGVHPNRIIVLDVSSGDQTGIDTSVAPSRGSWMGILVERVQGIESFDLEPLDPADLLEQVQSLVTGEGRQGDPPCFVVSPIALISSKQWC